MSAVKADAALIRSANDTASGIPATPYRVVINQQNAHVYTQCLAKIIALDGQKLLVLPFPQMAENIQLFISSPQEQTKSEIVSWSVEKALPFKPQGAIEKQRITLESIHDSLAGALANLRAQELALTEAIKENSGAANKKNAQQLAPELALIGTRIAATQREIDFAKKRATQLTDTLPGSQQLVVRINSPLPADAEILVSSAYTLSNTFWSPIYFIDANTKDNTIDVQLLAQITQNSDLDWHNVELELTTAQGNDRAPMPINPWVVRKGGAPVVYAKSMAPPELMMARGAVNDSSPSFDQDAAMARWSMSKVHKIPEGKTLLKLSQDKLNIALIRLARPSVSDNKVWLSAKYKVENNFYPSGEATFLLDGVMTSQGRFAPKGAETEIFFGVDPLVTVQTKEKVRKSAEQGLIEQEQSWTWNWVYSIQNTRNIPVVVRIEEAQTQVEDSAMKVSYADEPKPESGPEKTFVWNVETPAKGTSMVKRSITVKAPKDMQLDLGRW